MLISFSSFSAILSSVIFFSYWLLIVTTSLRVITRRRTTSYITSWLLLIYLFPFIGVILYFLFGEICVGKTRLRRARKQQHHLIRHLHHLYEYTSIFTTNVSPAAKPLFQLCRHQTGLAGIRDNKLRLLSTATRFFDQLISDIERATSSIKMVFYIWNSNGEVKRVTDALIAARKRGVSVYIMLDSAGSRQYFHSRDIKRLKKEGIEIVEALKVNIFRFLFRRLDLRQHRKLIIIDHNIMYTGSMNMVDPRYFKEYKDVGIWIDIMVRIKGPITLLANVIYTGDWALETNHLLELPNPKNWLPTTIANSPVLQIVPSGPGYSDNMIHQILLTAIYNAQHKIILSSPYFVPSNDLILALCTASRRGVDVIIIVPKNNDSTLVKWASRALYTELLLNRIKIYEFLPNLLHSKLILIDSQVSFIGTVNLDMRSLWLNFEITTLIDNSHFSAEIFHLLHQYIQLSERIELKQWKKRPFWYPIIERIFSFFSPLL